MARMKPQSRPCFTSEAARAAQAQSVAARRATDKRLRELVARDLAHLALADRRALVDRTPIRVVERAAAALRRSHP